MKENSNQVSFQHLGLKQLEEGVWFCYRIFKIIFFIALIGFLFSGVHTVPQGKVSYIQRFGTWVDKKEEAGLHFAYPFFIDKVIEFDYQKTRHLDIDRFFPLNIQNASTPSSRVLLAKGGDLFHCKWRALYRLSDPRLAYTFLGNAYADEQNDLKQLFSSICVKIASKYDAIYILNHPDIFKNEVYEGFQQLLKNLNSGFELLNLSITELRVPEQVKESFQNVQNQMLTKEKIRQNALAEAKTIEQEKISKVNEILSQAYVKAEKLKANLKAEANRIELLFSKYDKETRENFLKLKLQSILRNSLKEIQDQTYLLNQADEIRLHLGEDPIIDKIRRQQKMKQN